jgi:AraC-like DNA-binding protein
MPLSPPQAGGGWPKAGRGVSARVAPFPCYLIHPVLTPDALSRLCLARERLRDVAHPVSVAEAARAAGMSPFHFIRLFGAVFGDTPAQVRIRARLDHARVLLASTDLPVTDVCFAVGFASVGSFGEAFRRRVGAPPTAYRRRFHALGGLPTPPGCLSLFAAAFSQFPRSARVPGR